MTIKNHDDDDDDTGVKKKFNMRTLKKRKERERKRVRMKKMRKEQIIMMSENILGVSSRFFFNFSHLVLIYFTAFLCVKNVFSAYSNSLIVSGKNFFLLHHPLSSSISLFNCRCYCIHVIFF